MNQTKPARPARALVCAFYTVFLLWVATRPQPELPWSPLYWDKVQHAGAFFVLTVLAMWTLGYVRFTGWWRVLRSAAAVLYALTVGGWIELLQKKIPGRDCDPMDFLADLAGAGAAVVAVWLFLRIRTRMRIKTHGPHSRTV